MGGRMIENWETSIKAQHVKAVIDSVLPIFKHQWLESFEVKKVEEKEIVIRVSHNIAGEMEPITKHICYFLNGIMLGFGEFALYRAKVDEVECLVDTHKDSCLFSIKKNLDAPILPTYTVNSEN